MNSNVNLNFSPPTSAHLEQISAADLDQGHRLSVWAQAALHGMQAPEFSSNSATTTGTPLSLLGPLIFCKMWKLDLKIS